MSKLWRVATTFVAVSAVLLAIAAVTIPSLLRARIAVPHQGPYPTAAPYLAPPATLPFAGKLANEERQAPPLDREGYAHIVENALVRAIDQPLSTFSVDVDTASYANVRRFLSMGQLPPKDAVRIEEMVNYFGYDYDEPRGPHPFSVTTEVAACPWREGHRLVLIGLQGRRIADADLPPRNLVFLVDVSGSMNQPQKLPLVKASLGLLADTLREQDTVALVVYAGAAGLVLPPTPGDRKAEIRRALDRLEAGGSTAGGAGIELAYKVAGESFVKGGINRVILATDGDFNVGVTSDGELVRLIEEKRKSRVFLSVLGFGMGNYQDAKMEQLADKGDGNYAYIDTLHEARKVLVEQAGGTLVTIAKDVKIQVEFNPARVAAYRLIGYENRVLAAQDFNDDKKDAGEIGAGHSVTALYEIVPAGMEVTAGTVDALKYQQPRLASAQAKSEELMTVKLRYKAPEGDASRLLSVAVRQADDAAPKPRLAFASAVAGFGMLLRESEHKGTLSYAGVRELAGRGTGADPNGYRSEFVKLVAAAEGLAGGRKIAER